MGVRKGRMTQKCVYSHCCLCLDSMSIICSCLCHPASVVSVPLAPAEGGWTPPRAPPPPPPYSITAAAPYSALSLLPSAVLRRSQHGAGPLDAARSLPIFPPSLCTLFPFLPLLPSLLFYFSFLHLSLYLRHSFAVFAAVSFRRKYRPDQSPREGLFLCRGEKHRRSGLENIETTSKQP